MTAYNKINGTIGILNPEVTDILKKQYGLRHVVSDGGAMGLVVNRITISDSMRRRSQRR